MVSTDHSPVMLNQVVEAMAIRADGRYMDGTYGRGGHAAAMLERLGPDGRLWLLDRDPEAVADARNRWGNDSRCEIVRGSFARLDQVLPANLEVDGVLLDLGVSSPQLDAPERGFSFTREGPLDMRMDPETGVSAAEWLAEASPEEIARVLRVYGEEPAARRIARAIVERREQTPLRTTAELAALVSEIIPSRQQVRGRHPATRTFQALRIQVNGELEALRMGLEAALRRLRPRGRLVVISFHSLEDRMVKRFMRDHARVDPELARLPVVPASARPLLRLVGKARRPQAAETETNPRARSAVLRVAERLDA